MKRTTALYAGFTLLELLVTLSIVVGIITVVFACFEGGFRVYARIQDFGSREADVYLAGEMLEQDLGSIIPSGEHRFHMRELYVSRVRSGDGGLEVVHVQALEAGGATYWTGPSDAASRQQGGMMLVPDGMDVTFSYAAPEGGDTWASTWDSATNLPLAVRMSVRSLQTGEDLTIHRTFVFAQLVEGEDDE